MLAFCFNQKLTGIFLFLFLTVFSGNIMAQEEQSDLMDELSETFKNDYLIVSAFILTKGTISFDDQAPKGATGFTASNARLKLDGHLSKDFNYKIYVDFTNNPVLLDAEVGYHFNDKVSFTAGAQKPGISGEFLQGPNVIDFASRSQIVQALTQNRDVGIRLHGSLTNGIAYTIGMFNGNRISTNDNNQFYYAGRVEYNSLSDETKIKIASNLAYGIQSDTKIGAGVLPNINGKRFIYGGDLRYEGNKIIFSTEVLGAQLEYTGFGNAEDTVFGYQVTSAYKFDDKTQVLIRWDSITSDLLSNTIDRDLIVFGFTKIPTKQTRIRFNYSIPANQSNFENHGIAMTFQIGF